jgi:hypothetical protein
MVLCLCELCRKVVSEDERNFVPGSKPGTIKCRRCLRR